MKKIIFIIIICSLSFSFAEQITLTSVADSYILDNSPNSNYGTTTTLYVKNVPDDSTASYSRKAYIKFDLSSAEEAIGTAGLKLIVGDLNSGVAVTGTQVFNVFGIKDNIAGEDWGESTITWNNAPGNDLDGHSSMGTDAILLGTFTLDGQGTPGEVITFSNSNLINYLNDDTNNIVSFAITRETVQNDTGGWIHNFASKEHSIYDAPTLDLTYNIPEISNIYLLGIFIVCAAIYRLK